MSEKILVFILFCFALQLEGITSTRYQSDFAYDRWAGSSFKRDRERHKGPHFKWQKDGLYLNWDAKYPKKPLYKGRHRKVPRGPQYEWRRDGLYLDWDAKYPKKSLYKGQHRRVPRGPHYEWRKDGLYLDWRATNLRKSSLHFQ